MDLVYEYSPAFYLRASTDNVHQSQVSQYWYPSGHLYGTGSRSYETGCAVLQCSVTEMIMSYYQIFK